MRYVFIVFICCSALSACTTITRPSQTLAPGLSIIQGATDETSTQINILAPLEKEFSITISFDKSLLETPVLHKKTNPGSNMQVIQFTISNLTPDLIYILRIYDGKQLVDERFFKTLPKNWNQARIFVISCMDDSFDDLQKKQWKQISEQKPDLLFLIGDTVYVDGGAVRLFNVSEDDIWRRYVETAQRVDLYKSKQLIPIFATWDDHDYGMNDGGENFTHKAFAKNVFKTFFPMQPNSLLTSGPGVSSSLKIGQQQFVFLDDRSFRTEKGSKPQSHFGKEQTEWLLQQIKKHNGPTWLISGDQFFGAYHRFESFEGHHPDDFKQFVKNLKQMHKPLIFISGDRHLSEFMTIEKSQLGYETLEITSSGVHARMHAGSANQSINQRRLFAKDGASNYLDLKIDLNSKKNLHFVAEVWGENFASFYRKTFKLAVP